MGIDERRVGQWRRGVMAETRRSRDVWRIDRAGSLDRLVRRTEVLPPPGPGEARVVVKAVGLNFADIFACLGLYSATPRGSFVPGLECAGVVEALGPPASAGGPASGVDVGDRVIVLTRFGGYASALNIGTGYLHPMPSAWSFAEAAAYPVQAMTAWYGLVHLGALEAGEVVLVHSAAGGVGLHALHLVDAMGATAVATVGHPEKRDFLVRHRGLPPARIVVRDRRRFGRQLDGVLRQLDKRGLDLVFDAVTGPYFRPAFDRLCPEGRHVVYGAADFMPAGVRPNYLRLGPRYLRRARVDPVQMIAQNRSVMAFNLIWLWDQADRLPGAYAAVAALVRSAPYVGATFGFSEAPSAMRFLQSGRSVGKVIVDV
jgi:synaptic vesicle membrane protein VAT-1